jgi:hypothetical protein
MWDPRRLTILQSSTAWYRDRFTFFTCTLLSSHKAKQLLRLRKQTSNYNAPNTDLYWSPIPKSQHESAWLKRPIQITEVVPKGIRHLTEMDSTLPNNRDHHRLPWRSTEFSSVRYFFDDECAVYLSPPPCNRVRRHFISLTCTHLNACVNWSIHGLNGTCPVWTKLWRNITGCLQNTFFIPTTEAGKILIPEKYLDKPCDSDKTLSGS